MAGGGRFLDHGRILLRHLIHLVHGDIDLLQAAGLLVRGGGDLFGDDGQTLDLTGDPFQRMAGVADQGHARADLTARLGDQGLDLLGGRGRTLSQGANLRRHHGEAAPGVARPRRLDACVQRQQVGLEGDLVDHADNGPDLGRRAFDLAHGGDGAADHGLSFDGFRLGAANHAARLNRPFGRTGHGGGDLLQGGGGFFQAGGLLFGAARQIVGRL